MFTGVIEKSLPIAAITASAGDRAHRLEIDTGWTDLRLGESIAVNGACLTIAELDGTRVGFDVVRQTLDVTNLDVLRVGDIVHVERAMQVGQRLDGHFVQGHVDCTAALLHHNTAEGAWRTRVSLPAEIRPFIVPRGSIAVDGISLTVAALSIDFFEVALIPTTLRITQIGQRKPGYRFNLEADMMAKTVVRFLQLRDGIST